MDDIHGDTLDSIICRLYPPNLDNEREQYEFATQEMDMEKSLKWQFSCDRWKPP